jgi:hypothetical protein
LKFTRSTYPDYPGASGAPCWKLKGAWIDIDADWNTRFPFGTSFALHAGRQPPPMVHEPGCSRETHITAEGITGCRCEYPGNRTPGFLLDLNAPIGEPNRLYLWLGRWHVTLGLPSVRDFRETGRETGTVFGRQVPVVRGEHFNNWLHPHIDGLSRYRYHKDEHGKWVRNDKPEPLHWGWVTIERR